MPLSTDEKVVAISEKVFETVKSLPGNEPGFRTGKYRQSHLNFSELEPIYEHFTENLPVY
jgi:hypothetical protein